MTDTTMQMPQVEDVTEQKLGEDWIHAITDGALGNLAQLCAPRILSRLLLPAGLVTVHSAGELVAEYRAWFGSCTDFKVEASRVDRVGQRLAISYRFLLRDQGDWYRIEQQLYCSLKDGRVQQLHLLCSGFQLVGTADQEEPMDDLKTQPQDPARDALLEFYPQGSDTASTCALLTPMIKSKLGGMQSGQVLEVRVNDPAAQGDVEAWSRMTGNPLLKMVEDEGPILRFFVKKK